MKTQSRAKDPVRVKDLDLAAPTRVHYAGGADGASLDFQHAGIFYTLQKGVSEWPYEIAERLARKFATRGVQIVHPSHDPDAVVTTVAPEPESIDDDVEISIEVPPDEPVEPPVEPEVHVEPAADGGAEEVLTDAVQVPEPPAPEAPPEPPAAVENQ